MPARRISLHHSSPSNIWSLWVPRLSHLLLSWKASLYVTNHVGERTEVPFWHAIRFIVDVYFSDGKRSPANCNKTALASMIFNQPTSKAWNSITLRRFPLSSELWKLLSELFTSLHQLEGCFESRIAFGWIESQRLNQWQHSHRQSRLFPAMIVRLKSPWEVRRRKRWSGWIEPFSTSKGFDFHCLLADSKPAALWAKFWLLFVCAYQNNSNQL